MNRELTDEQIAEILDQSKDWDQDDLGMANAVRTAIAADRALRPAASDGWQPIETAPKDFAAKLFRVNGFCVQGFTDATGVLCAQNDRQPWRKMHGKPTHWMPLPAAPLQSKPAGGITGQAG